MVTFTFPTYDPAQSETQATTLANLDDGQFAIIDAGIKVTSYEATCIIGTGADMGVTVNGAVFGSLSGVVIGNGVSQLLNVGSQGKIIGLKEVGARISGSESTVVNAGEIFGGTDGLVVGGSGGMTSITNSGTIEGFNYGLAQASGSTVALMITNTGTIKGGLGSFFHNQTFVAETIINSGTMIGDVLLGDGQDTYNGQLGQVIGKVDGGNGEDKLYGGAFSDHLVGGSGDDVIDGGEGADIMAGEDDSDIYYVDNAGDIVDEYGDSGLDFIKSTVSFSLVDGGQVKGYVEVLELIGSAAIDATGNELGNALYGNDAANKLDGGQGSDYMKGGGGNDIYVVDNDGDQIDEMTGSGIDTVQSSVSFSLVESAAFVGAVENLTLLGTEAINGTGNALANGLTGNGAKNVLTGGEGNDKLDGGAGADLLVGGLGNDTYVVDMSGDVVDETGGTGKDTVQSFISYKLVESAKLLGAVENLTLLGTAAVNGTGNALANVLTGNNGVNKLSGGLGNDVLRGGKGKDVLSGGDGNDRFDFTTSLGSAHVDTIRDMNEKGNDTIRVDDAIFRGLKTGKLSAEAFAVVTDPYAGVDASDRILFDQADGKLYFDRDGAGTKYKPLLFATVDKNIALTVSDFSVI